MWRHLMELASMCHFNIGLFSLRKVMHQFCQLHPNSLLIPSWFKNEMLLRFILIVKFWDTNLEAKLQRQI